MIGLLAAPIAAAIALLVVASLVAHDPSALYSNGQIDKLHVNPSLYDELGAVTLALALLMLGAAWFRKRILIGIAMALYGLSIFNLHYWGFGLPVHPGRRLVPGAGLPSVGEAQARQGGRSIGGAGGRGSTASRPQSSKRYTPPAAPVRRASKPKPGKELEAG